MCMLCCVVDLLWCVCVLSLLCCFVVVLLLCCFVVLLNCCFVVLLFSCVVVLLFCFVVVLLFSCVWCPSSELPSVLMPSSPCWSSSGSAPSVMLALLALLALLAQLALLALPCFGSLSPHSSLALALLALSGAAGPSMHFVPLGHLCCLGGRSSERGVSQWYHKGITLCRGFIRASCLHPSHDQPRAPRSGSEAVSFVHFVRSNCIASASVISSSSFAWACTSLVARGVQGCGNFEESRDVVVGASCTTDAVGL